MKKLFITLCLLLNALYAEDIYATFDVLSDQTSDLGVSVSGVVGALYVNVGTYAKKGDLLLALQNAEEKQAVESARIAMQSAQKSAEHAQKTYERYAAIADVIDKEKMDNYRYEKDVAALSYQNARTTLAMKEAAFAKTELRAPYDLVVTKKQTELGSIVFGGQTTLLSAMNPHMIKLVLKFDEKYWQKVKIGQKFTYKVDGSDKTYEGTITKIYPSVLSATREMQAEVKAADLMPGLFGNGMIKAE
ncbi:MAG: efflux RND transporter periplasmic adaptor subunit [Sulfurospirillum cavolei]|nr:efflux RND transporter periplasmic adaptor subunit [Sulfurospirillum cavolei]